MSQVDLLLIASGMFMHKLLLIQIGLSHEYYIYNFTESTIQCKKDKYMLIKTFTRYLYMQG